MVQLVPVAMWVCVCLLSFYRRHVMSLLLCRRLVVLISQSAVGVSRLLLCVSLTWPKGMLVRMRAPAHKRVLTVRGENHLGW